MAARRRRKRRSQRLNRYHVRIIDFWRFFWAKGWRGVVGAREALIDDLSYMHVDAVFFY